MKRSAIVPLTIVYAAGDRQVAQKWNALPVVVLSNIGDWEVPRVGAPRLIEGAVFSHRKHRVPVLGVSSTTPERDVPELTGQLVELAAKAWPALRDQHPVEVPEGLGIGIRPTVQILEPWADYEIKLRDHQAQMRTREIERQARAAVQVEAHQRIGSYVGAGRLPRSIFVHGGEGAQLRWSDLELLCQRYALGVLEEIDEECRFPLDLPEHLGSYNVALREKIRAADPRDEI